MVIMTTVYLVIHINHFQYSIKIFQAEFQWNQIRVCDCLKNMLMLCGFDNVLSLKSINAQSVNMMETYLKSRVNFIENLPKCHGEIYRRQANFCLLPAHRLSILAIPQCLENSLKSTDANSFSLNHPGFSMILRELIESALRNHNKDPQAHRYSEVLRNFCMYIYIMAGRSLYEMLSANLPLPKVSTIRELSIGSI